MAYPDPIILLIVDYHAAIGGKTPGVPLRTRLSPHDPVQLFIIQCRPLCHYAIIHTPLTSSFRFF